MVRGGKIKDMTIGDDDMRVRRRGLYLLSDHEIPEEAKDRCRMLEISEWYGICKQTLVLQSFIPRYSIAARTEFVCFEYLLY